MDAASARPARPSSSSGGDAQYNTLGHRVMWVLWPAFLVAGVLEMAVFAMVDPEDVTWLGHPLQLSRTGIYSLSFFVFWAATAASSAITTMLARSPFEVNRCPLPPAARPEGCPKREGSAGDDCSVCS